MQFVKYVLKQTLGPTINRCIYNEITLIAQNNAEIGLVKISCLAIIFPITFFPIMNSELTVYRKNASILN